MLRGSAEAKQPHRTDVGGLSVFCSHTSLRNEMAQSLATLNLHENRRLDILLDAPTGWAFCFYHRYPTRKQNTLVLTANPCSEYKLMMRRKAFVLSTFQLEAVRAFLSGERGEKTLSTPLSPVELFTLKLVATDHTNCEIARERHVSEQTVKNNRRHLFQKLNLRGRLQCYLYLFGNWDVLLERGWSPPPHTSIDGRSPLTRLRRDDSSFS